MRNTVAKRLRQEARKEMMLDNVPNRDLVWGRSSVINSPQSIRALYLRLKQFWNQPAVSAPAFVPARMNKRRGFHRKALPVGPALIESPLKLIKSLFPPFALPDGSYEQNPTTALAIGWAKAGRGDKVKALARQFA